MPLLISFSEKLHFRFYFEITARVMLYHLTTFQNFCKQKCLNIPSRELEWNYPIELGNAFIQKL